MAAKVEIGKTTLTNWERDLKEESTLTNWEQDLEEGRDNLKAVELEALSDKFYLATCKHVEFFRDKLSRIQRELETRDLSSTPTEKLFATRAHFY